MFCPGCGKEIYGEVPNFCPHCGRPQPSAAVAASPTTSAPTGPTVPRKRKKRFLWNYHTYNWLGHCPTCHLAHTWEHVRCPNDDAPMVMAFNCSRWNPFSFPMQTAHLRCLNNCGYTLTGFNCTRDGTIVTGQSVEFKPSLLRVLIYNISYSLLVLFIIALILPLIYILSQVPRVYDLYQTGRLDQIDGELLDAPIFLLGALAGASGGFAAIRPALGGWQWKFVRTFDLERVQRR
jgi:hypothetical protein